MSERIPGVKSTQDPVGAPISTGTAILRAEAGVEGKGLEEAVEYVLGDCFFAVGQTIGMRMTVDYDAVIWWHDHFRTKFLAAMRQHGNRWLQDREERDRGRMDVGRARGAAQRRTGVDRRGGSAPCCSRCGTVLRNPFEAGSPIWRPGG